MYEFYGCLVTCLGKFTKLVIQIFILVIMASSF